MNKIILDFYKDGNVCLATIEGLSVCPMKEFIQQPAEGILYDLNRDDATVLSMDEDDPRQVNDFAVNRTIRALKERMEKLEHLLRTSRRGLYFLQTANDTAEGVEDAWEKFKTDNGL